MQPKIKSIFKAGVPVSLILIGVVAGIMVLSQVQDVVIEQQAFVKRVPVQVTGDGNPGAGNSGFFYMMIYPHDADPTTTYAANLSNATAYEFSDTGDNNACTGETPYGTTFDIVIKVGVNNSDGYNDTTADWDDAFVWVNLTCADLSIGANTDMTEVEIAAAGTTYRYMQYYLNNANAGYTIDVGEHFNLTSVKMGVMRPV